MFKEIVETVGTVIDAAGIAVIVVGVLVTTVGYGRRGLRGDGFHGGYRAYRQGIGRAILLGLEFLVAADIIRTVAISPSFESVGVLALIVAVRTFLSFSLEVELEGHWPWQPARDAEPPRPGRQ